MLMISMLLIQIVAVGQIHIGGTCREGVADVVEGDDAVEALAKVAVVVFLLELVWL